MMCIRLFSYGRPVVVRCKGVRLGMGWVGSWVHKFTWQSVGLGWVSYLVGWVGLGWVDENRPKDNSATTILQQEYGTLYLTFFTLNILHTLANSLGRRAGGGEGYFSFDYRVECVQKKR